MNDFDILLSHIETWRDAYAAQHPLPRARSKRRPETLAVKSIQRGPASGEMAAFIRHVATASPALERFVKSTQDADDNKAILDAKAAAKQESDAREAKAKWLNGIIRQVDAAIRAGKLTAEETAKLENMIHRAAQRIGAVQ